MNSVLLLGNTGFIGRFIEAALLAAGKECRGVSRGECNLEDASHVSQLADQFSTSTTLIMCAGIKRQYGDTFEIFERNMGMVLNLCRALEKSPVGRIVFMSSAAVYGEEINNTSINEKTPIDPRTLYGTGRFASERLLERLGIPLAILRPPLVYGSGDLSRGYGPAGFSESIRQTKTVSLWGDGSEKREILYVKDLANIVAALLDTDFSGVLNPVSGKSRTYAECASILARLSGAQCSISQRPRSKDKVDHVFDSSLVASTLPGFRFTTLEKGLEEMVAAEWEQGD